MTDTGHYQHPIPEVATRDGKERVEVLITNYETWSLTAKCVEAIGRVETRPPATRIVDDLSCEPEPAGWPYPVQVDRNPERLGLVRSLDRAIRASAAEILVVFDSDAYPRSPFRESVLSRFDSEPKLGVLGFRTESENGSETAASEDVPGPISLLLGQRLHAHWLRLRLFRRESDLSVYSCAMAVRRQSYLNVGGFDLGLDWLDLDHDLCMKSWAAGWKVGREERIVVMHEGAGAPQSTNERVLRFYRSRWRLLRSKGRIRFPRALRAAVLVRIGLERVLLGALSILPGARAESWSKKGEGRAELFRLIRSEWSP